MTYRFIHSADLHLDTPFQGIGRAHPGVAERLRDASLEAFDNLIDLAITSEAAFVIFSGDLYDGSDRGIRAQLRFLRGMEKLAARDIGAFIIHGNHDPLEGWSAITKWPANVHIFGSEVDHVCVRREGELIATVYGVSYRRRAESRNLALDFSRRTGPGIHIGVLHCNTGNAEHAPYSPCSLDDLRSVGMDYWALGHIHAHAILSREPWVVYPGSLQGRSPKPSECGPKGACIVSVNGKTVSDVQFSELDVLRFVKTEIDIEDVEDLGALEARIREHARETKLENGGRSLIVRLVLTGAGNLSADLRRFGVLDELLKTLRADGRDTELWWESILDRTTDRVDYDAIRKRVDFSAAVLASAERLIETSEASNLVSEVLSAYPYSDVLGELSDEELTGILEDAKDRSISMLEEDDES